MNAAVGLCHFCERHGPCVVLCTRSEDEDAEGERSAADEGPSGACGACNPPDAPRLFVSVGSSPGKRYRTRRPPFSPDAHQPLRRACVRSLSCEVSSSQENSTVFFGDASRGHVLSYAFQIKDTRARGLKRWFSMIVLMKDKMYLLNIMPYLSKELEEIAKELQEFAETIFAHDQSICSQRSLRLKMNKMPNEAPRSLIELTGKSHIFSYLHMKFSGLLNSCTRIFGEVICDRLLPKEKNFLLQKEFHENDVNKFSIYDTKKYLGRDVFVNIMFCILTGIQIIVRGDSYICANIVCNLDIFSPKASHCLEYSDYVPPGESRLYHCKSNVAVPKPCSGIFRIDILNEEPIPNWLGKIPTKWPTLMTNIIKAIDSDMKTDILLYHIAALKEEWLNNTMVLKYLYDVPNSEESISAVKSSMNLKAEDDDILKYWLSHV